MAYADAVTRLGLYGGSRTAYVGFTARDPSGAVPEVARVGGRVKRKRYVVEVDGQFFEVPTIAAAEAILLQVRDLANESAARDVKTSVAPKPPRVSVRTISGGKTTSVTLQRQITRTQQVVNQAYVRRAKQIDQDIEISQLMIVKIEQEERDDENAILALLLM